MIFINTSSEAKKHYLRIARYFTYAKLLTLLAAVIFVLFAFYFYREDITVENFRSMIKYLDFQSPESDTVNGSSVSFESELSDGMVLYKNDIAMLKKTGLDLYDLSGQKVFSSSYTMTSPNAVSGKKYLLVYDVGGTYAAVFNTFSKIWETNFENPIIDAAINDNGDFCIITSEKGYRSAVYMFNSDFKKTYRWLSGEKYAVDVSMSKKKSDDFIVSAIRASGGFYQSDIIRLSESSDVIIASTSMYDELVLETANFAENVAVLTDKKLSFFNADTLESVSSFEFSRDSLSDFVYNEKYYVLALSKKIIGSENDINIFSEDGENLHSFSSRGLILDICISDDKLYQLCSGELTVYDLKTYETEVLETDKKYDRLISDDSTVIIACSSDAIAIKGE